MDNITNYVKIHFKGKDYIGQIENIDSVWQEVRFENGERSLELVYYSVKIIEKDTNCLISGIEIKNFFDIKPYEVDNG